MYDKKPFTTVFDSLSPLSNQYLRIQQEIKIPILTEKYIHFAYCFRYTASLESYTVLHLCDGKLFDVSYNGPKLILDFFLAYYTLRHHFTHLMGEFRACLLFLELVWKVTCVHHVPPKVRHGIRYWSCTRLRNVASESTQGKNNSQDILTLLGNDLTILTQHFCREINPGRAQDRASLSEIPLHSDHRKSHKLYSLFIIVHKENDVD